MTGVLQSFVPVLRGEGGKVLHFAVFAGLLQAGVAIGMAAADSLFLSRLGADRLPAVYLCMPLVMAAYAPAYSVLLSRLGIERLVRLTVTVLVAGALALGFAYGALGEGQAWLLFAGKFYAGMWFIGLYTLFWNFTDAYFSIQDGKRLYGLVAAGGSLGGLLGAGLVALLAERVGAANLYYAWAAVSLVTFPVFARLRRRYRTVEIESHEPTDSSRPGEVLRAVFATFARSRFAVGIAALCFAAVSLTAGLEFLSMGVLSQGRSAAELAVTLGKLQAVAYVLTMVVNIGVFGRIVGWLGVANTALVLPLTYIGAFLLLHLRPGVATAVIAFYAYQTVLPGIEYNNVNLLFNAVAPRVKAMLRTFVEAMAEPLATAFAGLFLLSFATRAGRENVALVGVFASCGALAVALMVRFNYVRALEDNLREDWLNFGDATRDWSQEFSAADGARLRDKAERGRRSEQRLAADLLCRARDPAARPVLHRLLSSAVPGEVTHLRPAIRFLIRDGGAALPAATAEWLRGDDGPTEPEVIDEFSVLGVVRPRRIRSWSIEDSGGSRSPVPAWEATLADSEETRAQISDLLAGSPRERVAALRALGDLGQPRDAELIVRHLADPDGAVRTEALRLLGRLAGNGGEDLIARAIPLLVEATDEQRHLVLRLVSHRGTLESAIELVRHAEYLTAPEIREAEARLVERGHDVVPRLVALLQDPAAPMPARLVAVRGVSRLELPRLVRLAPELVDAALLEGHRRVADFHALGLSPVAASGAGRVLLRFYRDAAREAVELVLQVMSRVGRLPDFELIKASLSSANPKERANAIETIQQGCTHTTFDRIRHVLDAIATLPAPRPSRSSEVVPPGAADPAWAERAAAGVLLGATEVTPRGREILEQAAGLAESAYFGEASARVLAYLGRRSRRREVAAGEVIYELGSTVEPVLYIVLSGGVEITRAAGATMAGVGAVFGERALMLDRQRTDRAVSAGATLLAVPCEAVLRAIEISPALGIQLYRFKTISAVNYAVA